MGRVEVPVDPRFGRRIAAYAKRRICERRPPRWELTLYGSLLFFITGCYQGAESGESGDEPVETAVLKLSTES
jgi:hypothetical protein